MTTMLISVGLCCAGFVLGQRLRDMWDTRRYRRVLDRWPS